MRMFLHYSMEHHSVDQPALKFLTIFSGQFSSKKLKFLTFSKQIRHSPLPTAFLNFEAHFLRRHLPDPFASWLAALETSQLTGTEIFDGRNFFTDKFLAKSIENPDFLRGKMLLCLYCLA